MSGTLLTQVVTSLVNECAKSKEYGVSLINIPDFDYAQFAKDISNKRKVQIFFLGFGDNQKTELSTQLPNLNDSVSFDFTVEAAEKSRNSGDEDIFRILIIKRAELEKISSLRWFPEISLEKIYIKSCSIVKSSLSNTNNVIESLIQALKCKPIRSILSFERVLSYLELLLTTSEQQLPFEIKGSFYKLGLCADKDIDSNNPSKDDFVARIRRNHNIIERIGNLEQSERQSITNYYSKDKINKEIPRLILSYYKSKNIELLKHMDLSEVEECLKAVKRSSRKTPSSKSKNPNVNPTSLAAQLIFDDNQEQIESVLDEMSKEIDKNDNKFKAGKYNINVTDDVKLQIKTEPTTERIALNLTDADDFGCVIRADVQTPSEAIKEIGKHKPEMLKKEYLDIVWNNLSKIATLLQDGETISVHLKDFLAARSKLIPFRKRLQDAPMLQVLAKYSLFSDYLKTYERLLNAINDEFPRIWDLAPSNAKEIINIIMSLDYIFVIGSDKYHAIPTPLHPLYLWKYVELSKEILTSKGVDNSEDCHLSDDDKAFIIRKADDIPDPLSVMLLPITIANNSASFLPLSGRLGMLPVYSNQPQINQSENGVDNLKQQITRYLCLYPHAGMMLKLTIVDPPSVETVVAMLKALNSDKDFNISGIEVNIFRTKEVPNDWIEIEDESLNDGMLGKYKGKRDLTFKLKIASKKYSYSQILSEMQQQQHLVIVFDPNEVKIDVAQNSKHIHIHPLCIPKIYKYNPVDEEIEIRPASEGGIFTTYASIIEKLNEHPSAFSHTGTYFKTPLKRETYDSFLKKTDWLIILDQSLKSWDIALRAASEKLFYRESSYRSIGVYSNNCRKFIVGYDSLIKQLGNFIPNDEGIKNVIEAIRDINDDGLLSIVSHTSNRIFDVNHGKGSLGTAITALKYKQQHPNALLVGLDTQLAQEWLADRDDGKLPDLISIRLEDDLTAIIDIIEVKTYSDNINSFTVSNNKISGHAVEQAAVLEDLVKEMFGSAERITTISRREILREQVFDGLFQADMEPKDKRVFTDELNELFAGQYKLIINKNISFIDFENPNSEINIFKGEGVFANDDFTLITTGSVEIQAILANSEFIPESKQDTNCSDGSVVVTSSNNSLPSQETVEDIDATEAIPKVDLKELEEKCARINKVFRDYKINAHPVNIDMVQEAARFTRFSVELKSGESIKSIEKYKADIGRQLEANGEILINHIKGTKYISVDVPFVGADSSIKLVEHLKLLDNSCGRLDVIAGQSADGKFDILDIAGAPHMLVAGTTGSGKTVFLHSILISLLHQFSSDELEILIIDPKQTDFIYFEGIPHLYGGKVIIDAEDALLKLQEINTKDKEARTAALRSCRSKDIDSYNQKNPQSKMKRLVVIIDEYSDLIQAAEMQGTRKEFEKNLLMLLQRVRNLGIHLIIATQRPSAQIVTGALKAVIPFRVSFRLPSHTDSQTILDMSGAENLLGKGDMLMVTENDTKRLHGLYISEAELEEFIENL
ncbi:MAG: DNA translocase FtsK [Ruminococcus sp.]|nr:DNA translocase FtsK [Ruminococcus sp.]